MASDFKENVRTKASAVQANKDARINQTPKVDSPPVVDGEANKTPFEALMAQDGWKENELNRVRNNTYKITMFMTDDEPFSYNNFASYAELVTFIYNKKRTIIAESGVTGLNIQSLEIKTVPATNPITRSMAATRLEMSLQESMGVSFMDLLADSAYELNVNNYAKCQFFIEVRFLGYGDDGAVIINPCQESENKGVWLYHVAMLNIDVDFDSAGSRYRVSFVPFEEQIQDQNDLMLPDAMMPEGKTVGQVLDNLAIALNNSIVNMYGYATKTYEFKFKPFIRGTPSTKTTTYDISKFTVVPEGGSSVNHNPERQNSMNAAGADMVKAHFARGTSLNDVVDLVLANSKEAQQLAKDVMAMDKVGDSTGKEKTVKNSTVFQTQVVAEVVEYDVVTERYIIKYTIIVGPYSSQRPILSVDQVQATKSPKVQADNLRNLRQHGYLVKRYDYLFTGLDTEVLKLDVKFNTAWSALLPRMMGYENSLSANEVHALKNPVDKLKTKQTELLEVNKKLQEAAEIRRRIQQTEKEGKEQQASDSSIEQKTKEDKAKLATFNESELEKKRTALVAEIGKERKEVQAKEKSRMAGASKNRATVKYAEDIIESEDLLVKHKPIPISFVQSSEDSRYMMSGAFPEHYHRDRTIFSAVMNQLQETQGLAMQSITMEIKGDPYWLGSGNFERSYKSLKHLATPLKLDSAEPDTTTTDFARGDVLFMLSFKYARGYDFTGSGADREFNGNVKIKDNDFFTGVYVVRGVTHTFSGGMFTQTLDAMRMPLLDVFKAFGYRDKEEWKKIEDQAEWDKRLSREAQDTMARIGSSGGRR